MIHKTAIINDGAQIASNVEIGAFCVIGANVKIGEGTILKSHVVIDGDTTIGKNNIIYPSLDPSIFELRYPQQDIKGRVSPL